MRKNLLIFFMLTLSMGSTFNVIYATPDVAKSTDDPIIIPPVSAFSASLQENKSVKLTWEKPTDISGIEDKLEFRIYKWKESESEASQPYVIPFADDPEYIDEENLLPGSRYNYKIIVTYRENEAEINSIHVTRKLLITYNALKDFEYIIKTESTADLIWKENQPIEDNHSIGIFKNSESTWVESVPKGGSLEEFNVTDLINEKILLYIVDENNNIISDPSNEKQILFPSPKDLIIKQTNKDEATIFWTDPIMRANDKIGLITGNASPVEFVNKDLEYGIINDIAEGINTFKLCVLDDNNIPIGKESELLTISKITTAPTDLIVVQEGSGPTLKWSDPHPTNTEYIYQYDKIGIYIDNDFKASVNKGKESWIHDDAEEDVEYTYKVAAIYLKNETEDIILSEYSNSATQTFYSFTAPGGVKDSLISPSETILTWDIDPVGEGDYKVGIFEGETPIEAVQAGQRKSNKSIPIDENGVQLEICAVDVDNTSKKIGTIAFDTIRTIPAPEKDEPAYKFTMDRTTGTLYWRIPTSMASDNRYTHIGVYVGNELTLLSPTTTKYDFNQISTSETTKFEICAVYTKDNDKEKAYRVGGSLRVNVKPISEPSNIKYLVESTSKVKITWEDPEEDGYEYIGIYINDNIQKIAKKGIEETEISGLDKNKTYTFYLCAVSGNIEDAREIGSSSKAYKYKYAERELVVEMIAPIEGGLKADSVIVKLTNKGDSIKEKRDYIFSYKVNSASVVKDTFALDSFPRDNSVQFTFRELIDLSKKDKYKIEVFLLNGFEDDMNIKNDSSSISFNYDKDKEYDITILPPKSDCITLDPAPGITKLLRGDSITLTATIDEECEIIDDSLMYIVIDKDTIYPEELKAASVYTFNIPLKLLLNDVQIEVKSIDQAVGNELILTNSIVYTQNRILYVESEKPADLTIYTINGQLQARRKIGVGTTTMQLPIGVYLVIVNEKVWKVSISN